MSSISSITPANLGCSTCPGSENVAHGSKQSLHPHPYRSGSVGRTLGRRSLDAFSSMRGSLRGRWALHPTTNQKLAVPTSSVSVDNGPLEPPTKQRWYDLLRGKSSQIPTPSTPAPMSPTLKRSRLSCSSPNQSKIGDLSPSIAFRTRTRDPLPKLHIASFKSELQRTSIFGDAAVRSPVDPASQIKLMRRSGSPKEIVQIPTGSPTEAKSAPQAQVASAAGAAAASFISTEPAGGTQEKSVNTPRATVAFAVATADRKTLDTERILCDLYYKGSPWQPEFKKSFPDATSALSQFTLRHMLTEKHDCSNTLLWTSELQETALRVNQTFTVYPLTDGPKRAEIQRNFDLHWAIIRITHGLSSKNVNTDLNKVDRRLTMAVRNITLMGYHVDVWTCLDDDGWAVDLILAEAELARDTTEEEHIRSPSRSPSVVFDPQHIERRKRYDVFARQGVAGFLQADLDFFDKLRSGTLHSERFGWNQLKNTAGSELMGFLEHTEETIVEAD